MNPTVKHVLGAAAAIAIGALAPLATAASPAAASAGAHCARAEQDVWDSGPSRTVTARGCTIPSQEHRWYTVEIDTLVERHYKGESVEAGVDRSTTVHGRTIRCLGHTSGAGAGTVDWFGCPPV
ncbi:hypothetical protein SAMN04490357_7538 [Streptomyces misionensis]|uniref:Secreted protein n=1 Tax=Streptomyces misionensis TaxID=67331 RepID=A0A1H5HLA1_9ACTN|nr:hypothetical protein SAMN04490357_7538 [Streptomyces misionensis]